MLNKKSMQSGISSQTSSTFIWRRVHSLMGFWLVLYLILHLITNSQAALWLGNEGSGFVRMVNALERLPYLHAIEIVLIGIPLAVHLVWGVYRAFAARTNSFVSDGTKPVLRYERNIAYTFQRWSSWILLFGIIGHVVQMRFLGMPKQAMLGTQEEFMVKLNFDKNLYALTTRLGVKLYHDRNTHSSTSYQFLYTPGSFQPEKAAILEKQVKDKEQQEWEDVLNCFSLKTNEVVAIADSPGKAILLMVRETFKSPLYVVLYTIFLLAATFHAFNGFWTFLITWGVILSYRSQKKMIPLCMIGVIVLTGLGLAAIWGSYWMAAI